MCNKPSGQLFLSLKLEAYEADFGKLRRLLLSIASTLLISERKEFEVGGTDLPTPFRYVFFGLVKRGTSVGKVLCVCFAHNCSTVVAIPINNGGVANESSLGGHTLEANVEGGNSSAAATSMDEATTHIAHSSYGCIAYIGVLDIWANSVVNDPGPSLEYV
ncbi:hypothetical protein Tco_0487421 [Tanacetum coccineum]